MVVVYFKSLYLRIEIWPLQDLSPLQKKGLHRASSSSRVDLGAARRARWSFFSFASRQSAEKNNFLNSRFCSQDCQMPARLLRHFEDIKRVFTKSKHSFKECSDTCAKKLRT
jgi:hypothetical protein